MENFRVMFHSTKAANIAHLQTALNSKICWKNVKVILDQAM